MKARVIGLGTLLLVLTACAARASSGYTSPTPAPEVELKHFGPAPELTNTIWLNVPAPLRLADLRGQVVLIDMWTYG